MILRPYITMLISLVPILSMGQVKTHVLNGYVHIKDAGDYKYQVVFAESGSTIEGYSITTILFGNELKTTIKGDINTRLHTLNFIESKTPVSILPDACYFDVKLSWKLVGSSYIFTGTFIGRDKDGKFCDQGTVTLKPPQSEDNFFEVKKTANKNISTKKRVVPPVEEPTPTKEIMKVTATVQKEFEWRADSCILEVWDGEFVDGDIVTILFNGEKILSHYTLTANKKRMVLAMPKKTNTLSVYAENEGQAPPNTSQIVLTDGNTTYSLLSCLKTGETATITLKKKK